MKSKITTTIHTLKKVELGNLCRRFGLTQVGNKSVLVDRIATHVHHVQRLNFPARLIAIDVGTVNLGYALLEFDLYKTKLLDWKLLCPEMPKEYNVQKYAMQCRSILDNGLFRPDVGLYLIERQSWRSLGPRQSIPHAIIKSTIFESLLMGMLMERGNHQVVVDSILPGLVSDFIEFAPKEKTNRYKSKKEFGVAKATEWIESNSIESTPALKEYFYKSKKRDDLSDSLLLGLAYTHWIKETKMFLTEI
jgi:hypothetical protein